MVDLITIEKKFIGLESNHLKIAADIDAELIQITSPAVRAYEAKRIYNFLEKKYTKIPITGDRTRDYRRIFWESAFNAFTPIAQKHKIKIMLGIIGIIGAFKATKSQDTTTI